MRGDIDTQRLPAHVAGSDDGFVGLRAGGLFDGGCLLRAQLSLDQGRQQRSTDGVGALHAQMGRIGQGR
ncbi:hypothetical protein D3C79_942060 [compost metagenome]